MKAKLVITILLFIFANPSFAQIKNNDVIELIEVQKIMDTAFQNSQIVMMNEAHSGQKRNIRTRIIGQLVLPKAHSNGVRYLAMEALTKSFADKANEIRKLPELNSNLGYLHQPEMRNLMQLALDLGWNLLAYEADTKNRPEFENSLERSNWREKQQAINLNKALDSIGRGTKLLIWCGNSHLEKEPGLTPDGELLPMGYQFQQISGIEPYTIDQILTVDFLGNNTRFKKWESYEEELKKNFYGTLGYFESPKSAKIISIYNSME